MESGITPGKAAEGPSTSCRCHQFGNSDDTTDRAVAEWFVRADAGATLDVEVRHDRAGVLRTTVTLEAP